MAETTNITFEVPGYGLQRVLDCYSALGKVKLDQLETVAVLPRNLITGAILQGPPESYEMEEQDAVWGEPFCAETLQSAGISYTVYDPGYEDGDDSVTHLRFTSDGKVTKDTYLERDTMIPLITIQRILHIGDKSEKEMADAFREAASKICRTAVPLPWAMQQAYGKRYQAMQVITQGKET